ncbi:MAG: inorganic diphosphatase [Proteobacteria bacterium]|nr:inorganic diphosphatase [Pseudomonadota bacterium]
MNIEKVGPGNDVPEIVNAIIEIPMHSEPVKYEIDKKTGALFVDRFIATSMYYPANYGYVPNTLSEDGDPVDVLVVTPVPLISGSVIRCRPVGLLRMTDESGVDAKVIAVPHDKLSVVYRHVKAPEDLPSYLLATISHFFEHYKDLEEGKWVKLDGWSDAKAAKQEILNSIKRYAESQ